jgi:hypothetical protein
MDSRLISLAGALLLVASPVIAVDQTPGLTVESDRQRQQLQHDVDAFVSTALVLGHSDDQTIERWTYKPICPTVAGLTKLQGEFLLSRISEIARQAGAPLASQTCKQTNLFVVVTSDADGLMKRLEDRRAVFNYEATKTRLDEFEKPRPVRTWYNAGTVSIDGTMIVEMLDTSSTRARPWKNGPVENVMPSQYGSRLNASTVTHDILSAIVIVDRRTTLGLTMGQLADYVAVVGLAQIDLNKDFGSAPTVLNVFRAPPEARPAGVTPWDLALLHALYTVNRSGRMALSDVQSMVLASVSMSAPR